MSTPITDVLDKLDATTQAYTFNGYAALVNSVHTPVTLAITAYIAFIGWMTIKGWGTLGVGDCVKHSLKIAVAYTLATQWSYFAEFIYNVFSNGPNELSSILMQSAGSGGASVNSALQDSFNQGMTTGEKVWNLHGISPKLTAIVIWVLDFVVTGIALLELAVAKCGLAVTLVLAPVFSLFLLWNSTKGFFDRWLSVSLGFGLVPLFLTAVLLIVTQLMQMGLTDLSNANASAMGTIESIVTFVLGSIVSIALLFRAASIAANVAGGFSVSALAQAAAIGRFADAKSGFKDAREWAGGKIKAGAGKAVKGTGKLAGKLAGKAWSKLRN